MVDVARAEGIDHLDLVAGREIIAVLPRHDRALVAQRKHHDVRTLFHHGAEILFIFLAVAEELGVVELRADEYVDLRQELLRLLGIAVAVILGFMRVIGETMVVWMASGNSLKIPEPFYNFFEPVRTLTATIAGEMGEADQTTGSARYHVLFAMSLCLLVSGMALNWLSQRIISRGAFARKKGGK